MIQGSHIARKNCGTFHPVRVHQQLLLSLKRDCSYRKKYGIFGGAFAKATWASRVALFVVLPRSIEQVNATYMLRGLCRKAVAIAKLETDTVGANNKINKRQLLLSLKLRGSAFKSRCRRSGGISGGVSGLYRSDRRSKSKSSSTTTTTARYTL